MTDIQALYTLADLATNAAEDVCAQVGFQLDGAEVAAIAQVIFTVLCNSAVHEAPDPETYRLIHKRAADEEGDQKSN